jgi:CrcB protein
MIYLWIGLGSALGGMARYACQVVGARLIGDAFPWGTFIVNIIGCSVIGFFAAFDVRAPIRQFVMVGILGGYTTFSSFSLETLTLARDGQWAKVAAYVLGSLVFCLLGVFLGNAIATAVK